MKIPTKVRLALPAAAALLGVLVSAIASAQLPVGVGMDSYGRYYSCFAPGGSYNNPISAMLSGQGQIMETLIREQIMYEAGMREIRRRWGAKKIEDGLASTTFIPNDSKSTLASRVPGGTAPVETEQALSAIRTTLDGFNKAMEQDGLKSTDIADGIALAFVMSYAALHDEDPGPTRLKAFRDALARRLLADPIWQSHTDEERQVEYESAAINAMSAIAMRVSSNDPALTDEQRETFRSASHRFAGSVLKSYLSPGLYFDGLELTPDGFGDKGERLARLGTGSTTFTRIQPSAIVKEYVSNWNADDKPDSYFTEKLDRFQKVILASGGQPDDLADANATAFAILYFLATDGAVELNQKQVRWVRAEMHKDILADASFQRSPAADRQRAFDKLAIDSVSLRDSSKKMAQILKQTIPADAIQAMGVRFEQEQAREQTATYAASAKEELARIFKPRDLKDFVLVEDGFVAAGTGAQIQSQPGNADSPALSAFGD